MSAARPRRLAPSRRVDMSLRIRLAENIELFRSYRRRPPRDFAPLLAELDMYDSLLRRFGGHALEDARALEIGYGALPYRMLALLALDVDVWGVDAEAPVLQGSASELWRALRTNGFERFAKSAVRSLMFDSRERESLRLALAQRDLGWPEVDPTRFLVGDAASCAPPGRFDLIYSINVFEHVQVASLEALLPRMASWLRRDGIALIRADIWTGLPGSHLIEWRDQGHYPDIERRSEPWEHLRKRRFEANTTLNELTRADYRRLFREHFEIVDEIDPPRTGQERYLTTEIREELSRYTEEDLLDSHPLFVLRPLAE